MSYRFNILDRVRYHPIIGGPDDGTGYTVRDRRMLDGLDPIYWLTGHLGFVPEAALSVIPESNINLTLAEMRVAYMSGLTPLGEDIIGHNAALQAIARAQAVKMIDILEAEMSMIPDNALGLRYITGSRWEAIKREVIKGEEGAGDDLP